MIFPRLLPGFLCAGALVSLFAACRTPAQSTTADTSPGPARLLSHLENGKPQTLVLYGTSLTERGAWSRLLAETLRSRYPNLVTVHNSAGSGQNSRWGLEQLVERVIKHRPDTVMIEFSINDSVTRFDLSLEESRANLVTMIERLEAALPEVEIILQVMNPVVGKPEGDRSHRRDQSSYADVYRAVARQRGLRLIDHRPQWDAILKEGGESGFKRWVRDGVHPSVEANAQIVFPHVARELGLRWP